MKKKYQRKKGKKNVRKRRKKNISVKHTYTCVYIHIYTYAYVCMYSYIPTYIHTRQRQQSVHFGLKLINSKIKNIILKSRK